MQGRLTILKGGENPFKTVKSCHMRNAHHRLLHRPALRLAVCLLLLASTGACQAVRPLFQTGRLVADFPEWQYADLRQVDPADAAQPSADILAIYLRAAPGNRQTGRLEIRLDLLDGQLAEPVNWIIALDHAPGGNDRMPNGSPAGRAWDSLLVIPDPGAAPHEIALLDAGFQPRPAAAVRVLRNLSRQQIEISLNLSALPAARAGLWVQAFSTTGEPLYGSLQDESSPAALQAQPPPPAPLLLAFWDVFPAFTPAQALRRWDGAHTGPQGGRHGLYNLLRAARNHAVTLTLLDLSAPESLSALDYAAGLEMLRNLAQARLLALPAWLPPPAQPGKPACQPYPASLAAAAFELPLVPYTSADFSPLLTAMPSLPGEQIDEHGLSLFVRSLLANSAAQPQPPVIVLGGSLPGSPWGIPGMARAAMQEIRARPWIRPVAVHELGEWLHSPAHISPPPTALPPGAQAAASLACSALHAPLYPAAPALSELRSRYLAQINVLQLVLDWSNHPLANSDCSRDVDGDSLPECILSSSNVFAVFQAQSAALSYLFVLGSDGLHQLVAPSSQFIVGQSPPASWRLNGVQEGLLSDPQVILGAFSQAGACQSQAENGQINFTCDGTWLSYALTWRGLAIHASSSTASPPSAWQLPLAFDPWQRFAPGWGSRFTHSQTANVLHLSYSTGSILRLSASQSFTVEAFDDSRQMMGAPENPNAEFPGGHYLPFPMLVVKFVPLGDLHLLLELDPTRSIGL